MAARKGPAVAPAAPVGPEVTQLQRRQEAYSRTLAAAIGPLGAEWRQRLTAEVGDPRLGAVVRAAVGGAPLAFDAAVAAFDSVHGRFADPLVHRVAQRPLQVPLVSKATIRGWRGQYGVQADAPVTDDEVLFWLQYSTVGACRQGYNPMDEAKSNPLGLLLDSRSNQTTFVAVASLLVLISFLARMRGMAGG